MKVTLKTFVVWALGLAVLLGSEGVGLALSKFQQGKTYCQCACRGTTGFADLTWEKVASCNINGKNCKFNDPRLPGSPLQAGKLENCMSCQPDKEGGLLCTADSRSATPGLRIPPRGELERKTPMPRGVEGPSIEGEQNVEQLPAEQPSGK
jgi:hypothetical protein